MRQFTKTIPARHPLVSELIAQHGAEAYAYLTMLLEIAHESGGFELTSSVLARECRIKNPKLSRLFPDLKEAFYKALDYFEGNLGFSETRPSIAQWSSLRQLVFKRDNFTCQYCGENGGKLECDHIVPVSRGGSHDVKNLTTACFRCNRSKGAKALSEWRGNK